MQHPTLQFLAQEMFESLRRWDTAQVPQEEPSLDTTLAAMDQAGVSVGLLSAWHGPTGALISNEEVQAAVSRLPDRFAGLAAVNLLKPMEAVRERNFFLPAPGPIRRPPTQGKKQ